MNTGSGPFQKILIYVDGSEECIAAAQMAIVMARQTGAALKALYVVNVSLLKELTRAKIFVEIESMDYEQDLLQDGKRYLRYIREMAAAKRVSVDTELIKGVVNKEVVEGAGKFGADLLMMGELEEVRSRTDSYHDEAELIFRKVNCSVMVVKDSNRAEALYQSLDQK